MEYRTAGPSGSTRDLDGGSAIQPNSRYEKKREYRKITITIPQSAYEILIQESARRKIAGEQSQLLSAVLREAIADYLKNLQARALG